MIRRLITEHAALDLRPEAWVATLAMVVCTAAWRYLPATGASVAWIAGFMLLCFCFGDAQERRVLRLLARHNGDRAKAWLDYQLGAVAVFHPGCRTRNRVVFLILALWVLLFASCPIQAVLLW